MDEKQLLQETEMADEYRVRYQQAKAAVNNVLDQVRPIVSTVNAGQAVAGSRDLPVRTFKLPKIQLPKFSGELRDWLKFGACSRTFMRIRLLRKINSSI